MIIPTTGWSNKCDSAEMACACGTWKQHWMIFSDKTWPGECSVRGCHNKATVGARVMNKNYSGECIIPLCDSCSKLTSTFTLKEGIPVPSANTAETCEKKA